MPPAVVEASVSNLNATIVYNGARCRNETVNDALGTIQALQMDQDQYEEIVSKIKNSNYFTFVNKEGIPFDFNGVKLYSSSSLNVYITFAGDCLVLTKWPHDGPRDRYDFDVIRYGATKDMKRKLNQVLKRAVNDVDYYIAACKELEIDYVIHL